ncbi:DUF2264 domain-containing protein [Streptomyces sp. E11-3]|uniref:DUF2264 domain-containing protein n=1 Tax=Streptomyces sp. E11-3 TaxID=3110112 RepID=UPI00397F4DC6
MLNPLAQLPLESRSDLQEAVRALCAPLARRTSPAGARVRAGHTAAHFGDAPAELEGFARPLWGLVPLAAGGGDFDGWERYREGLVAGTDPGHPEYWGAMTGFDQRMVESAAVGLALALVPEHVWDPLPPKARRALADWLFEINRHDICDNNWLFFRVLVNLGLARVGERHDHQATHQALDRLESFHIGQGWYADGPARPSDYYVPWALHFYGLVYAKLAGDQDRARAQRFRERAAEFAGDFLHWFAADGSALPYGRSLTYRFAQGAFWGALAFADVDAVPPGVGKGLLMRHLRWWAARPIFQPDGTLSIGYGYPNLSMAEGYNSPGSPYWALKAFLPLALADEHPFWAAKEEPLPRLPEVHPLPHAQMTMLRDPAGSHVVALTNGQPAEGHRHSAEKYAKFAYSTTFGFSVPVGGQGLAHAAPDSMLALSDDGTHFRVREEAVLAEREGEVLHSRWEPWPGVEIDTWLLPHTPWHIRIHRLRTDRTLASAEGGFAVDRAGHEAAAARRGAASALAWARGAAGASGIRDLTGARTGEVINPEPNTNLVLPRTALPLLHGRHDPGEHWLACAVLADPDTGRWEQAWDAGAPPLPEGYVPRP